MAYNIITCSNEEEFEQFARFFLENRGEFMHPYSVKASVHYISNSIKYGRILLALNDRKEAIGFLVFSLGTPENGYEDSHVIYISFLLIRKDYRKSKLFLHGLKRLLDAVGQNEVKEIRFMANTNDDYLRKLYGKFARVVAQKNSDSYVEDIYILSYSDFSHFVTKVVR